MQHFYDGQVRRYLNQLIRLLSHFTYKDGKGELTRVPVMYGDITRQVAGIIRDNSENKIPSAPRIGMYVTNLEMDRTRTADSSYVSKLHVREREYDENNNEYLNTQGRTYTVERLMPSPYNLTINADIWSTNTDQKLQIVEQILMLFNPSLEIQTTDNFVDWTSLSVVNLEGITWSSRSIPQGVDSEIDVATLTFQTPIYISPPAKVKKLGVITQITMSINDEEAGNIETGINIDGFSGWGNEYPSEFGNMLVNRSHTDWHLLAVGSTAQLVKPVGIDSQPELDIPQTEGTRGHWQAVIDELPGEYRAGLSKIFLRRRETKTPIVGYITLNPLDANVLAVDWDIDTLPTNSILTGPVRVDGNIDAVVNPERSIPARVAGTRFLITENIGDVRNVDGPDAWKNSNGTDFVAKANDIIEWDGTTWHVVFESAQHYGTDVDPVYITNTNPNSGLQFKWTGTEWLKAWEGAYQPGWWQIVL
jgi:hypothetical protein